MRKAQGLLVVPVEQFVGCPGLPRGLEGALALGQFPDGMWEGAFSKAVPFLTGWWRLRCWF